MEENKQPKTREEWFSLVLEHKDSKLTQADFCKEKNIKPHQLSYYRQQYYLKMGKPKDDFPFSQVVLNSAKTQAQTEIKIELPNGFICYVSSSTSSDNLKRLIGILMSC